MTMDYGSLDSQNAALSPIAQNAQPAMPAADPSTLTQRQALAAQLAKISGGANTAMRGQMVGNRYVTPSATGQGFGALAQFAPALAAFLKQNPAQPPVAQPQPVAPPQVQSTPIAPTMPDPSVQ